MTPSRAKLLLEPKLGTPNQSHGDDRTQSVLSAASPVLVHVRGLRCYITIVIAATPETLPAQ